MLDSGSAGNAHISQGTVIELFQSGNSPSDFAFATPIRPDIRNELAGLSRTPANDAGRCAAASTEDIPTRTLPGSRSRPSGAFYMQTDGAEPARRRHLRGLRDIPLRRQQRDGKSGVRMQRRAVQ
jgi:hypothetical protein